jgi:folylpolyglutamate synthase/dihydropteroate synthase
MTQANPYLALVQNDVVTDLKSSMQTVADRNPDAEAKLQQLAEKAGVPLEAARLNQSAVERQVQLQSLDYQGLAERYPSTAALLMDPNNAALAKDDVPAISGLEDTLNFGINAVRSLGAAATFTSEGLYGVAQAGLDVAASSARCLARSTSGARPPRLTPKPSRAIRPAWDSFKSRCCPASSRLDKIC